MPSSAACTTGVCTPGIEFKQYGVALSFTPVVLADNRISIRVATDVTEIDPQQSFNFRSAPPRSPCRARGSAARRRRWNCPPAA